jgi:dTDP-4-dehydrorhamnose 3,5-epimerase-like enzyme
MPNVNDIKVENLPIMRDARGNLVVAEFSKHVPFPVVRLFYVYGVPANTSRGKHAHRRGRQYLICQSGRVHVDVDDGTQSRRIELNAAQAVLIENGIFASETYVDQNSVLLVLCDIPYDRSDYIESREEFLRGAHPRR